MTMKAAKPIPSVPAVEADERRQADVDAYIERNRDELNESIRRSRLEVQNGVQSTRTIGDIVSDGRKRHRAG